MLRFLACAALLGASPCFAQSVDTQTGTNGVVVRVDADTQGPSRDRFVLSGDECGSSLYSHFVEKGAESPELISLPADANEFRPESVAPTTLEYKPARLNIVFDDAGRLVSVGCS